MINKRVQYFVEGECEKHLVDSLKAEPRLIVAGKSKVFNPVTKKLTPHDFIAIPIGSVLVFVFDTDVDNVEILEHNLKMVRKYAPKVDVILVPQVKNMEEELVRATTINTPLELTNSQSLANFKTDFIALKNCRGVLEKYNFDIKKLWIINPNGSFEKYKQESQKIKTNSNRC